MKLVASRARGWRIGGIGSAVWMAATVVHAAFIDHVDADKAFAVFVAPASGSWERLHGGAVPACGTGGRAERWPGLAVGEAAALRLVQ